MSLRDIVPEEFYRGDDHPYAETVEELIYLLQKLPGDLPIKQGFNNGCTLIVFNVSEEDAHLEVMEVEEDDDDSWFNELLDDD